MPWPEPSVLERITPTTGEMLRTCPLRVAFGRDPRFKGMVVPSTWALLGTAAHRLSELAAQGLFADCGTEGAARERALEAWEAAVQEGYEKLLGIDGPLAAPPPPKRWPAYQIARVQGVGQALQDYGGSRGQGPAATAGAVEVELWLEDTASPLAGRIDRLEHRADGLHLVDLKSSTRGHEGLQPSHARQLLVYSYLVHHVRSEWPRRVGVRYLDGREDPLDLVPADAQEAAAELRSLFDDYNHRVAQGVSGELATPSQTSCVFCDYQCLCEPFFAAVSHDWVLPRTAILGEVAAVSGTNTTVRLDLRPRTCTRDVGGQLVAVRGVPAKLAPQEGMLIALSRLRHDAVAASLTVCWDSRVAVWSQLR